MMVRPNASRERATTIASLTQRRIIEAARTPCDSRDRLTCSIICFRPWSALPTSQANAPSSRISPDAIERVPSLSFSRTIR